MHLGYQVRPSRLRPQHLLLQLVLAFFVRRLTRRLRVRPCRVRLLSGALHETRALFAMDIFGQCLELGKHLSWDCIVRDVGAYVLVPGRPFVQMLTLMCALVANYFRLK